MWGVKELRDNLENKFSQTLLDLGKCNSEDEVKNWYWDFIAGLQSTVKYAYPSIVNFENSQDSS